MKYLIYCISFFLLIFSCNSDPCPDAENPIDGLFTLKSTDVDFLVAVDYPSSIQGYSFKMNEDGTISCIGYQAHQDISEYTFQITDKSGVSLIDVDLAFTSDTLEFIEIPAVNIIANEEYTISRICNNFTSENQLVSRVLIANNTPIGTSTLPLPLVSGSISITDVEFSGGQVLPQNAVPYIDFGFVPVE